MKKLFSNCLAIVVLISILTTFSFGCGAKENRVVIFTSAEDYRNEYMQQRLDEEFPEYDIVIEYLTTGNQAAKLFAEGTKTECDISYDTF